MAVAVWNDRSAESTEAYAAREESAYAAVFGRQLQPASQGAGFLLPPCQASDNVRPVTMRFLSPFRYPGGKSWLIPEVKRWVGDSKPNFVEPFCGGASVSLELVKSDLVLSAVIADKDKRVISVFSSALYWPDQLCSEISKFKPTLENVKRVLRGRPSSRSRLAFRALVANRFSCGGIMAPGAGLIGRGERGRGLASRWYPETLCARIREIRGMRDSLMAVCADFSTTLFFYGSMAGAHWFIDPPYRTAGRRLYMHHKVSIGQLFRDTHLIAGRIMMTLEDTSEALRLAREHKFGVREIKMKSNHHATKTELILTREAKAD